MPGQTFSGWLNERVGDGPGQVSRRELARRLAHNHPDDGQRVRLVEAQRRNLRKILAGQKAQQSTRDAICDALGVPRESAPSVKDEDAEEDALLYELMHAATGAALKDPDVRALARTLLVKP